MEQRQTGRRVLMIFKPYKFQLEDARWLHRKGGRGICANEMGTGKTVISLMYADRHPELRPVLVVCPAYLKWNWARIASKLFGMNAEIIQGYNPPTHKPVRKPQLVIANYEILADRKQKNGTLLKGWRFWLRSLNPQIVIIDEPQHVRTRSAARTKATKILCKNIPHVIALGGTAGLEKKPAELFPILNIVRPDLFNNWENYAFRFCGPRLQYGRWTFDGATHLDELRQILIPEVMIRRRKEDVLKYLPKKRKIITLLEIEDRDKYRKAEQNLITWLAEEYNKDREDRVKKNVELNKFGILRQLVASLKRKAVVQWINHCLESNDGKLILYGWHIWFLTWLHQQYPKNSLLITGAVDGRKRQYAFDQFLSDKRIRILFGNIQAAGTGWSAKGKITTAFAELAWNPSMHSQAEDRTHGIERGEKGTVAESHWLISAGTIEEMIAKGIQRKQKIISRILDGKGKGEMMNIHDMVREELMKREHSRDT